MVDEARTSQGYRKWWTAGGSNSWPPRCERGALPAELAAHVCDLRSYHARIRPGALAAGSMTIRPMTTTNDRRLMTNDSRLTTNDQRLLVAQQLRVLLFLRVVDQLDVLVGNPLHFIEPALLVVLRDLRVRSEEHTSELQ